MTFTPIPFKPRQIFIDGEKVKHVKSATIVVTPQGVELTLGIVVRDVEMDKDGNILATTYKLMEKVEG